MKKILKLIIIIILIILAVSSIYIKKGYDIYINAIEKTSVEEKIEQIKKKKKKNYTEISEMPEMYKNAVLAVEDHRFYKHKGIDIISIGRAVVNDIKSRGFEEGGSTITQQLAKNIYFTQEKKIERKIAEVFMSAELEKKLKKDEILELYLNTSYFGDGKYTVREASKHYFNKEPSEMSDYESIMLAGIPNAPSVYAPTKNPELAKKRQKQVINKMIKYKYLTKKQADKILKQN